MNEQEIAQIIGFVHALCPAQKMDEYTPDAWELVLEDLPFADAKAALKVLGQKLRFIAPADIVAEVRRVRGLRGAQYTDYAKTLPDADPDDSMAYIRATRQLNFRAASQLPERPVQLAIETTFVYVQSKWTRGPIPLRAIEAAPDPEYDAARTVLAALPPQRSQDLLTAARGQLETDGIPLDHHAVAIRAADLATRTEGA